MSLCGVPKQSHHAASGGCWVFRDTAAFTSGAEAQSGKGEREERRWKRLRERPGPRQRLQTPRLCCRPSHAGLWCWNTRALQSRGGFLCESESDSYVVFLSGDPQRLSRTFFSLQWDSVPPRARPTCRSSEASKRFGS